MSPRLLTSARTKFVYNYAIAFLDFVNFYQLPWPFELGSVRLRREGLLTSWVLSKLSERIQNSMLAQLKHEPIIL